MPETFGQAVRDDHAHRRIDHIEDALTEHNDALRKLEESIVRNTRLTEDIARNTGELVTLFKGAKAVRGLIVWFTPVVAAGIALWAWLTAK